MIPSSRNTRSHGRASRVSGSVGWVRASGSSAGVVLAALLLGGCASAQHLGEYDFRQKTLDVVSVAPPYPEVFNHLHLAVDGNNALEALVRAGSEIARAVSADETRARLDSAAAHVDVSARMSERLLEGASRQLRTRPVRAPQQGDFELEVRIKRYGITASSWSASAHYLIDADLVLLDGATGRRIWKKHVTARRPVGPSVFAGRTVRNVVTAVSLARASTAEIERSLAELADFSADTFTRELADGLAKVRD